MASAPNIRIVSPPVAPGGGTPAEGEGGDIFASLLSIVPSGETILDGPGQPEADVPVFDAQIRPVTDGDADPAAWDGGTADEADAGDEANGDVATPPVFTPAADFIPILQAQASYSVAATVAAPAEAELPVARAQPSTAPVPAKPAPADTPQLAAQSDGKAPKSAPRPAAPTVMAADEDGDAPELSQPVKAALKAAMAQAKTAPADASAQPAKAARAAPQAPAEITKEGRPAVAKAVASAPASVPAVQAPASPAPVQAQPVPAAAAAAPIAIDPTVQTAPVQRAAVPLPQPADQAIERELDLAHDSEWLDRLARDIVRSGANDGPMRFKLHPQTLGHLRVELTQGDHGTTVRLIAETEAARAIIADAQPRLLQEARAQGVRIAHAEVDLAGTGHQASGDPRRQEDGRQPNFIRTARGAGFDAAPAAEPGRASSDRYA